MKDIGRIYFYVFSDGEKLQERARAFYTDGTDGDISVAEGKKALSEIANRLHLSSEEEIERELFGKVFFAGNYNDLLKNFDNLKFNSQDISSMNNVVPVYRDNTIQNGLASPLNEDSYEVEFMDEDENEEKNNFSNVKDKISNVVDKAKNKIKNHRMIKKITAGVLGLSILSLGTYAFVKNKSGQMQDSNLASANQSATAKLNDSAVDSVEEYGYYNSNNSSDFDELIVDCKTESQKKAMKSVHDYLYYFNDNFAGKFAEPDKNIRPVLTWEEVMSLMIAYNDYSRDDICNIFSGVDGYKMIAPSEMLQYYQNAMLQLMCSYVIETRETPVDINRIITSFEGKNFVSEYHELFLQAKEATGEEKISLVKKFYDRVRSDFHITDEICREGISDISNIHIEKYKLAVIPMISAAEMMFQDLRVDNTLSKQEIAYLNEQGLCNKVLETFEAVRQVVMMNESTTSSVSYYDIKKQVVDELTSKSIYFVSDESRNLMKLDRFLKIVVEQYEDFNKCTYTTTTKKSSSSSKSNSTRTTTRKESTTTYETKTTTKTTSNRAEAINKAGLTAVEKAEQEVNRCIEQQNQENKRVAEEKAEQTRKEMQEEANKQAEKNKQEVEAYNKDTQTKIEKANEKINSGKTVTEKDFDNKVTFDNNHSDGNGTLDNSVKNITTDGSGAKKSSDPLPDPNKTGAAFDAKSSKTTTTQSNNSSSTSSSSYAITDSSIVRVYTEEVTPVTKSSTTATETHTVVSETPKAVPTQAAKEESNVTVKKSAGQTIMEYDEKAIDNYLNSLEQSNCDTSVKVYTK